MLIAKTEYGKLKVTDESGGVATVGDTGERPPTAGRLHVESGPLGILNDIFCFRTRTGVTQKRALKAYGPSEVVASLSLRDSEKR